METLNDHWPYMGSQAVAPLNVIIVGAGIAGLTAGIALARTGHVVTIFESASAFGEVGAGMQLAPNACRILHRLGILQEVMECASVFNRVSIRRYSSDEEIATTPLMPSCGLKYGAPMCVIHRGDLQRVLLDAAYQSGCEIKTGHTVTEIDGEFAASVRVYNQATGDVFWCSGGLVIAADGIKSVIRRELATALGFDDRALPTGDAAYRLLIPRHKVKDDPVLVEMMDQNVAMRYLGPGGHIMAYPLRNNSVYNLVLLHPTIKPAGFQPWKAWTSKSWTSKGYRRAMLDFYRDWSPAVRKWLEHADEEISEWTLDVHPRLPWCAYGSLALIGDACHPMLPYVAQGAANAIEDAAVLATALTCTSDITTVLDLYETVRKERGEKIAASARETAKVLHLPDGPEQMARDRAIRLVQGGYDHPDKWGNTQWQDFMWGVDVMGDTIDQWNELVRRGMAVA